MAEKRTEVSLADLSAELGVHKRLVLEAAIEVGADAYVSVTFKGDTFKKKIALAEKDPKWAKEACRTFSSKDIVFEAQHANYIARLFQRRGPMGPPSPQPES